MRNIHTSVQKSKFSLNFCMKMEKIKKLFKHFKWQFVWSFKQIRKVFEITNKLKWGNCNCWKYHAPRLLAQVWLKIGQQKFCAALKNFSVEGALHRNTLHLCFPGFKGYSPGYFCTLTSCQSYAIIATSASNKTTFSFGRFAIFCILQLYQLSL